MKGQGNVLKIKLACSRSPKKKRKKMDGKKKRGAWFCYQWEGWGGTLDDTRLLKRLKKSKIVKDEFEKGCWLTSSKGTAQQTGWEGDSWPLSLKWRSPHSWPHTPYCRMSGDIPEDFWKTVCSGGREAGDRGPNEEDCTLVNTASPPESPRRVWRYLGVNNRYQCLLQLIELIFSGDFVLYYT